MAIDWPDVEEVVRLLDIGDQQWIEDHLQHELDAAIDRVKGDVGNWDEYVDVPDEQLRSAVLRCIEMARPNDTEQQTGVDRDPIYQSKLKGHRRRFGIA